jgi:hypothetical protein
MYLNCLSFTEIIGELSQIIPMKWKMLKTTKEKNKVKQE